MIFRPLLAGALLLVSCGSLADGGVLSGTTASPASSPGRPVGTAAPGYIRLTDDPGGWSIDRPATWFDRPEAMHGRAVRSYDFSPNDFPPPPGGIGVSLRLAPVYPGEEALDLEGFADRNVWTATCTACRRILERGDLSIGGQPAKFFSVYQNQPAPFQDLEPYLYWLVRSPFFADRVFVIKGGPAASPERNEVERMIATIQFFRPAPPVLVPTRSRDEVIASVRNPGRTITSAEAKLMRYGDFERAYNDVLRADAAGPSAIYGGIDPDTLVWVVAFTGSGFTPLGGGPAGLGIAAATPVPWGWSVMVVPAREPYSWSGPMTGGPGTTWPAWFDALPTRG
ncbi:MAG: hypothetical protein E6H87_11150 [Chloroflexi bacterium]|nr:MAG: hypothetical protein E6H87_11150 [Chloroflexota bacterium]